MTWVELFTAFHPVIDVLGTLCLIVLTFGSTLLVIVWVIKKTWKFIVAAGVITLIVVVIKFALIVA